MGSSSPWERPRTDLSLGGKDFIEFLVEGLALNQAELRQLPAVVQMRCDEETYLLAVTVPHLTLPCSGNCCRRAASLARLTTRHASLEDVFMTLTGRHLRDDA